MDALVEAAKAEGRSTSSRCRRTGPTTARSSRPSRASTASRSTPRSPTARSQEEINAAKQLKGTDRAPDVFDLGGAVALANTDLFAPYKVDDLRRHPRRAQGSRRALGQRLHRLHVDRLRRRQGPGPDDRADLLKPEYNGKVALNGDPTQAGAAFNGVLMAALANGGSADDIAPGVEFFRELKAAGNLVPVDPTRATIESGQTPVVIDWDYTNAAQTAKLAGKVDWKVVVPRRRVVGSLLHPGRSTRGRRTRPPPGSGRSSCTPTRARTCGSRASAGRSAPTPWRRPARSTRPRCAALPAGRVASPS